MTAPTTAAGRKLQLAIRAQLLSEVAKIWPLLDPKRLDATFPGWLQAMKLVTKDFQAQSSSAAGVYYRSARERFTQSPAPSRIVKTAPQPSDEWMSRAYGYSGPGLLQRDIARPNTALTTTMGTAARIVLDGGQTTIIDTVHADPVAVGWYRVTDGDPCAFCALLASRGIAYKSEKTADFEAHNLCGCNAAPAFTRDESQLPELNRVADDIYVKHAAGAGSGKQLAAFRKAWAERRAQTGN